MNEQIEIQKQLNRLRDRVKFLREWIRHLNSKINAPKDVMGINQPSEIFEIKDKIYQLENEVAHKEYLIEMREGDQKMFQQQREAVIKQVNRDMGGLIKQLRTKIFPDVKQTQIADGIIKRFSKNSYKNMENKIADFSMAQQLLK